MTEEVRVTSSTGGAKGSKPQRMALLPPEALMKLSEVYAFGAEKYDDFNYRKGYPWHLSADALQRHFQLWNSGQDLDDESGLPHILHAAWHCLTLYMFSLEHPDFDDRFPAMWEKHLEEVAAEKKKAEDIARMEQNIAKAYLPNIEWYNKFVSGGPYKGSYPSISLEEI